MELKCGIIGLPNVGKSTLFNALTNSNVNASNYPFCTIEPNISVVTVPDKKLDILSKIVKTKKITPSTIKFVDIAGLIKGASKGHGLGNKFLNHITEMNAIIHVVRFFEDTNILNISPTNIPINNINIINNEIIQFDISLCIKQIKILSTKNNLKKNYQNINLLNLCLNKLKEKRLLNTINFNIEELKFLNNNIKLLTIKPMIIIANISENELHNKLYLNQLQLISKKYNIINICAKLAFNKISKLQNYYLNKIIIASFNLLNLNTFYTVGIKETKSWSIIKGTIALEAAKKIHSDIKKGFIRAKVINYNDYIFYKNENKLKLAGKIRLEGKNYIIKNRDIIHFLFKI
ncbi:redox-regulated ATPase YchF [Enterobacteriaceae endosymbiont of Plateumaris consimilis]|uniref:redox-regulated ATPase YchF n=1 Tax=Enterobacteriaceae endosymbiont of Plateumaris consimilis TaxID=2675794 RepID=UPI001448BA50|nr:redox-regulated ATPase YchF [Enterobacteriaceae endosymbiont of Plateumaris consimilis]QJC28515.1 redox-regulated ATPase YchF [Enterobacteriaceae endosymbiont of Plateumaris consimilis]